MYKTELVESSVSIDTLLKYHDANKVENYCKNCPNYKMIWSCPPHDFDTYTYLKHYTTADLYALKVYLPEGCDKDEVMTIFQKERRAFSDKLISMEDGSEALIAGNCYQCEICERAKGRPCILKDKKRYSLEALGLMVGEVTSNLLGVELKWSKGGLGDYLVTVGALFK